VKTSPDITDGAACAAPPRRASPDTRPGRVWVLPGGPGCAGFARHTLADALSPLRVSQEVIADAQLMVSELATNVYQHADDHGPHELWFDPGDEDAEEAHCAVFDAFADAGLPGYSWTSGDCGRGLSIVRELSVGRWGVLRTRSRTEPFVLGKAVWFAVPMHGLAEPPFPLS